MRFDPSTPTDPAALTNELPLCDTTRRFVRVIETRTDRLVAFEFAIGWPDLCVELLLDNLGVAQYLTRLGLALDDPSVLDEGKEATTPRRATETCGRGRSELPTNTRGPVERSR
jgi:phenol hydroxylase P0 protein